MKKDFKYFFVWLAEYLGFQEEGQDAIISKLS
jgi:hypothetical protein